MLQRAASNAYSWWVAGHIRTKQSKWLEQNLQDMEEKVTAVVKLISEEGDSFAKRAEMYYKKRPEIVSFVEESFRAYRALAERYDHISKELQSANNTLASAFPEQFQYIMDDEDEDFESSAMPRKGYPNQSSNSKTSPSVPKHFPTKNIKAIIALASKVNNNNNNQSPMKGGRRPGNKAVEALRSGFSKNQAVDEIDKLQKTILAMQTEKEFTKNSYESGVAKYIEIEKEITEMQEKVSTLQDEFGVGKAIEDNEARTLMLEAALKSCQDAFAELQERQAKAEAEAREERLRIKNAGEKILSFKGEFQISQSEPPAESQSNMVETIDELVNKVISLESAVSSQTALIERMRLESDELQAHIQSLEDDRSNLIDGKNLLNDKLKEMEERLKSLQELDRSVERHNSSLQTQFLEASSSLDVISQRLPDLTMDRDVAESKPKQEEAVAEDQESRDASPAMKGSDERSEKPIKRGDEPNWQEEYVSVLQNYKQVKKQLSEVERKNEDSLTEMRELTNVIANKDEEIQSLQQKLILLQFPKVENNSKDSLTELRNVIATKEEEIQCLQQKLILLLCPEHKSEDSTLTELRDLTNVIANKDKEIQSLQQKLILLQFPSVENKTEDSLTEFRNVIANKEEKIQSLQQKLLLLQGPEHKSEDSHTELRELTNVIANKDEEIQSLQQKLILLQFPTVENNSEDSLTELKNVIANKDEEIQSLQQKLILLERKLEEYKNKEMKEDNREPCHDNVEVMIKLMRVVENEREMSPVEAKLRSDVDEILEDNLDFWIRFSAAFSEIQKFQTQVQDLHKDLAKVEQNKTNSSQRSDSKAIYKHLKGIQAELIAWLEQSMGLKEELQRRFSQLCNIQEVITRALNEGAKDDEMQFTSLQAAKFQGEVLNMQQENNRVADELQASLDNVTNLQIDIERTLSKLNEELGTTESKSHSGHQHHQTGSRNQVPLHSFIFGVKPKKQRASLFSCIQPNFHRKHHHLK